MTKSGKAIAALVTLGGVLLGLNLLGLAMQGHGSLPWFVVVALLQGLVYLVAVWLVCRMQHGRGTLALVLAIGLMLRLSVLFSAPFLSDDIYRYVWDGRVQAAGVNPYRFIPADKQLAPLRDPIVYPRINRRDYARTIYPPLAQAVFLAATRFSESVTWMKAVMTGFEAIAVWLLIRLLAAWKLPPERVLIYAWSPLAVWEIAGSGHVDAVALALLALALWARGSRKSWLVGIALAGATLIKLYPILLFPALYRRWDWKMPLTFFATVVLAYAPYLSVGAGVAGFLPGYFQEEGLQNGGGIFLLNAADFLGYRFSAKAYLGMAAAVLVMIGIGCLMRRRSGREAPIVAATVMALAFTVLFTPHYAWYLLWMLPMLCIRPYLPALFLTVASFVLYEALLRTTGPVLLRTNALLYLPFLLLALVCWWISRSKRGAAEPLVIELVEESTK